MNKNESIYGRVPEDMNEPRIVIKAKDVSEPNFEIVTLGLSESMNMRTPRRTSEPNL